MLTRVDRPNNDQYLHGTIRPSSPPWQNLNRRRLPIGIQSFRRLRESDCYHVDKTPHIRELAERF